MNQWNEISTLIGKQKVILEKIYLAESRLRIEGEFELPPLAQLSMEDQIFIVAFVKSHGHIKEMERLFGVSYPTIKSRLQHIVQRLGNLGFDVTPIVDTDDRKEILERLDRGELTAAEALELLEK